MGTRAILTIKTSDDKDRSCLIPLDGGYSSTGLKLVKAYKNNSKEQLLKQLEKIDWQTPLPEPRIRAEARDNALHEMKFNGKGIQVIDVLNAKPFNKLTEHSFARYMAQFAYPFNGEMFQEDKPEGAENNQLKINDKIKIGIMDINPADYQGIEYVYILDLITDSLSVYTAKSDNVAKSIENNLKIDLISYACTFCLNRNSDLNMVARFFLNIEEFSSDFYYELEKEIGIPWEKIAYRDVVENQ